MTKARPPSPGEQISLLGKLARDLGPFLRSTIDPQVVAAQLRQDVATRADRFVTLVERAVFANPGSPYRQLMGHAGITLGDLKALVGREWLEGALERLADAGVYLRLDEFKGRKQREVESRTRRRALVHAHDDA